MNVPSSLRTMSVRYDHHIVNAAENGKQWIGRVRAFPNAIKIDVGVPGDHAVFALELYGLHSVRQLDVVRCEVSVDFGFGKDSWGLVRMRRASVGLDMVDLSLSRRKVARA